MPDAAGTYTDGALKFGSQILTIKDSSGADQTYIAESFKLALKANWLVTKNESGVPNKQAGMKDVRTGSATLQFAATTTKAPKLFAEFTAIDATGSSVNLIVGGVDEDYGQDQESKFTIEIREKLN